MMRNWRPNDILMVCEGVADRLVDQLKNYDLLNGVAKSPG